MRDHSNDEDRTASLMTPAKLAQLKVRPAPAASPAAWLDQMAADAGSGHVRRLLDLRQQLQAQLGERGLRTLCGAAQSMSNALDQLDLALLEPRGWLARATGKGKEAAASYQAQHERLCRCGDDLADDVRDLLRKHQPQAAATDRLLLEFGVEVRAVEKIMDQGARWLQDMRNQIKARQAQAGDAAVQEQVRQDSARCELLVERLKLLRAANAAAQEAAERSKSAVATGASLLQGLQRLVEEEWKPGRQQLEALADQAAAGGAASEALERGRRLRDALRTALQQSLQDCAALQAQEQAATDVLAALQAPLQAAG